MSPASQSVVFPSTVLIVDDNKLSNENLAQILMLSGYKTQIADNGASALNSIKHHTPDLILLDVKLPDFNGIDLCKNLKKDPIASTIPVIFMSGYTETDSILSALEAGGVDFISKPFQSVEVLARIKTHLTISSELAARKRAEELLQKNESALKEALIVGTSFIDAGTGSVDFTVISDTILKISGAKYVSFNLFESNGLDFTTVSIAGISDHIQKFPAMFGIDIINKKWKHDPVRAEKTKDKNITHFETLHELTGSAIPVFVSEMVERVFDIGCVELVKISKNNKVLGDFTLLFSRGESIRYQDIVLLFSSQVGLFLDRIQAERTVEKQRQLLQSMGRMASVGGWEIDVETMNLIWTDEVYRIHEAAPDFIPSVQTAINFYASESKTSIADAVQQAIVRGTPFDLELSIITARGNHRIVHTLGQAQLENGIVKRIFGTFQDITEQQKLLEVAQRTEKLESIGSLAGGIAHDFNNLLAGIFGYIDMARDSVDPQSKAAGYLAKALKSYTNACALTQQFLTFAKGGAPQRTTGSLAPLITEATQFALSGSPVECSFKIADDLWNADFDANQMRLAINNIVLNALQAMPQGGMVTVSAINATAGSLSLPHPKTDRYIHLAIADTGEGISSNNISRIFDPFFTTREKAKGLGLATVHSIIQKHDGKISVESIPGKGTTVTLILPASALPDGTSAKTADSPLSHTGSGRILIMDDDEALRETVGDMIVKMGYRVDFASNGTEALRMLDAAARDNSRYTAAVMDLTVPGGMGGLEAVKKLREIDTITNVFVASGYSDDPVMENPTAYGFTDRIAKPFKKTDMMELFKRNSL